MVLWGHLNAVIVGLKHYPVSDVINVRTGQDAAGTLRRKDTIQYGRQQIVRISPCKHVLQGRMQVYYSKQKTK